MILNVIIITVVVVEVQSCSINQGDPAQLVD